LLDLKGFARLLTLLPPADAPCAVAGMFGCAPMNSSYDYWKNGVPWEGPPVVFH